MYEGTPGQGEKPAGETMASFKAVIGDPKTGKTYQTEISGHHANSLVGKRIGDEFDGIFVALPGYKLVVTGGSDKDGFPMRKDVSGPRRKKVLISESTGFHPKHEGTRQKKSVRGREISPEIVQINMKITSHGTKPVDTLLEAKKKTEEGKEKAA